MLYEYYPAGGSSLKINLLLAMGHAAESLMEATIRNKSVEFFHKIAPVLHSGHIYPLLLCTPTLFPPNQTLKSFIYYKQQWFEDGGITAFKQNEIIVCW